MWERWGCGRRGVGWVEVCGGRGGVCGQRGGVWWEG